MAYLLVKYLHLVSAAVLLGTGAGIAFFMLLAHRTADPRVIAGVARIVVIADYAFTASAVVVQPATGLALATLAGHSLGEGWLAASLALYLAVGALWLPVVGMQRRMRDLAQDAAARGAPLPPAYHRLFRWWFAFGIPAFLAVLAILWLMVARPALG
ncbi:MAG: DUF2269 family protein [Alphaproteobacteria bacterium]